MPLFSRPDGTLATDVAPYRRIMPFLMRTRTESAVYFEQEVDLTKTLPFLEAFNAQSEHRVTVFHLFLWAAVRTLHERARLNRFVMGSRIYQRDGIWVSYSAKKALSDEAPIVVLKRRFDPALSFTELVRFVYSDLGKGRSDEKSHVDKELSLFLRLPGPLLSFGVRVLRWLDRWNLLPGSFIHPDPMYASLFVANLGSLKLESAYHHLYEYGNIPLFAAIGQTRHAVVARADGTVSTRPVCSIKYSLDERVEDGLYCARALEVLRGMLEDPAAHGAMPAMLPVRESA
ncbi:MAG: 2-oxo acid dehydrogenase subunit E2 [Myxococcota bacterium]